MRPTSSRAIRAISAIVDAVKPPRDLSHSPIFQVLVTHIDEHGASRDADPALRLALASVVTDRAQAGAVQVATTDVSDPADPQLLAQFGEAPTADDPGYDGEEYLTLPGNAHYVQPSPDGEQVYMGAESFPGGFVENPDNDDYGGIRIFDVSAMKWTPQNTM